MDIFKREGYILAAATGILYLMAYFSILARADVYGVPIGMMSFDLFQLTRAALDVLLIIVIIAFTCFIMYVLLVKTSWKITLFYFFFFVFVIPLLCYHSLKSEDKTGALIYSAVLCILLIGFFTLTKKYAGTNIIPAFFDSDYKAFFSLPLIKFLSMLFILGFLLASSYYTVYLTSQFQSRYDVFYKNGFYAVINSSADNVIAKKISNNKLDDGFYLIKIDDLSNVTIKNENIHSLPTTPPAQANR